MFDVVEICFVSIDFILLKGLNELLHDCLIIISVRVLNVNLKDKY